MAGEVLDFICLLSYGVLQYDLMLGLTNQQELMDAR